MFGKNSPAQAGMDESKRDDGKVESNAIDQRQSEKHAGQGALVRNSIIGFADGLTVPFALTAGLSALGDSKIVVVGGLAELFAGAISMGLGAYLAAVTERKHFEVEERKKRAAILEFPVAEEEEIYDLLERYGISRSASSYAIESLKSNEDMWVQFMMDFELKLEKASRRAAWIEGIVMAASYFVGGLLPMIPYFVLSQHVEYALFTSIGLTAVILVIFGYVKAILTGTTKRDAVWSSAQTLFVGALAAGVSYGIVRVVKWKMLGDSAYSL